MNPWLAVSGCTPACADAGAVPGRRTARRLVAVDAALLPVRPPTGAPARVLAALGVEVEHSGDLPRTDGRPAPLVVSNHVSWLDDLALAALLPGIRPVAKAEVADWPVVGTWARRTGVVLHDRTRLSTLPATVAETSALLRAGQAVGVHPEGTTACGARLGRFRPAFFQAAVDAAAPVLPVALRYRTAAGPTTLAGYLGDDPLWRSLRRVAAADGLVLEVHVLPALRPGHDRRELAALAEYSVAGVVEAGAPVVPAHPRPARRRPPVQRPAARAVSSACPTCPSSRQTSTSSTAEPTKANQNGPVTPQTRATTPPTAWPTRMPPKTPIA
ncbi:1-acyl-sn-glycerol-3-phosphate acyltransferase [Geodermatophilus normandii]|uniref:1-acyl-sn-glycerol-3-phosphate acyltransferase n=1 Tax=Geodermatophilus normandii TaxID=1137989 RepID=A0A6P0GI08_9ACTN|nr:1-acyl-sn-glycerol-3-phosphate acyltransferase [Geodermatophilus normandii]